ncbi:MAG: metallophosphoesterase [Syntrophaceae bacterium]|nr:metallophosphoesterase [Syntrophaceae bacterium]
MRVFLSDLHLGDGKERDDFQFHREFDDLVRGLSDRSKKIEMILLGDIFDLIRTQKYYEFEGLPHPEVKLKVMGDIVEQHAPFFETLRYFTERGGCQLRYVVGNHDFGTSLDPRLLEMVRERFGLAINPESYYRDEALGIWAEHGHRYDSINNTYNRDGTPIPYCLGDRIVVEIVGKFFERVREERGALKIDPAIVNDLDNVRPQSAISNWLDSIDEEGRLKQIYYDTIAGFVVNHAGEVASLVMDFISGRYQPDLVRAARDLAKNGVGKYIIFGHTHEALEKGFDKGIKHLNTGTWRRFIEPKGRPSTRMRSVPTYSEGGVQFYTQEPYFYYKFETTINLSYVLFYEKGEGRVGPRLIQQKQESG